MKLPAPSPIGTSPHARLKDVAGQVRAAVRAIKAWNERMVAEAEAETGSHGEPALPRGTRWGRGAAVLIPSAVIVTILGAAIADGVLAASFNVANQPFALNVQQLQGSGLVAALAAENVKNPNSSVDQTGVLHAAMTSASLHGVCIIVHQSVLGVKYSITVGSNGATNAQGKDLYFDVTDLASTNAVLNGVVLGTSADSLAVDGKTLGGAPGAFGLDGSRGTVSLSNVVGSAYQATVATSLTLPSLAINVHLGSVNSC